jgi:hypothetical protein
MTALGDAINCVDYTGSNLGKHVTEKGCSCAQCACTGRGLSIRVWAIWMHDVLLCCSETCSTAYTHDVLLCCSETCSTAMRPAALLMLNIVKLACSTLLCWPRDNASTSHCSHSRTPPQHGVGKGKQPAMHMTCGVSLALAGPPCASWWCPWYWSHGPHITCTWTAGPRSTPICIPPPSLSS